MEPSNMAVTNQLLNSSIITNAALAILHQKLNFIGSINRSYDDSFGQSGAKIGSALRIRLPNQYTVRSGPTLSPNPTVENQVTLNVTSQKGVDLSFSSQELTMNIDDFSARILDPAMAVLAASMEADALNMAADVYNQVNGQGAAQTFKNILQGRKILRDNLAPSGELTVRMNTQDNVDLVDALKGLFQASTNIASQYRDGVMGHTAGFEFAENTFLGTYTRGAGNTAYIVNGAGQTGSSLVVSTGAGAVNAGDVFTIANVNRVHPETKANTGVLQQFVVTAAAASGAGTWSISPAIVTTGALQNVAVGPAASAAITFAGTASTASGLSLAYHKDAFTFASADLVLPSGVDMAARKVQDGISMRMVRMFDINNDLFPTRFDVLYGFKTLRPQLAVRLAAN
jgi:hypothetical protein